MKSLRIAQLGDIHYPDALKAGRLVDVKDAALPAGLVAAASTNPLQTVIRRLILLASDPLTKPNAIALCGDLTSRGDMLGYESCVKYIADALDFRTGAIWKPESIHVVPGNHDIDRSGITKGGTDLFSKFSHIRDTWNRVQSGLLAVDTVRQTTIGAPDSSTATMMSVNSCLGCGEWRQRLLADDIPDDLATLFAKFLAELEKRHLDAERLDTPAFDEALLDQLAQTVTNLSETTLPVIVSHHNLLPQALPRIDVYTEVINGGLARNRLSKCGRSVLYLHGHIHKDPVEIITPAVADGSFLGNLVCVSAPELVHGFNLIRIDFGRSGLPLGVVVQPVRLEGDGRVAELPHIRIPLYDSRRSHGDNIIDDFVRRVISSLPKSGTTYKRFDDVQAATANGTGKRAIAKDILKDCLLEAEWLGFVTIDNRERAVERWQIRRIAP